MVPSGSVEAITFDKIKNKQNLQKKTKKITTYADGNLGPGLGQEHICIFSNL